MFLEILKVPNFRRVIDIDSHVVFKCFKRDGSTEMSSQWVR